MKALTLTQPWAQLMIDERKQNETRSWPTNYRGLLAIHAAKGFPSYAKDFASTEKALGRLPGRIPLASVVGVVRLIDVIPTWQALPGLTPLEKLYGDYGEGRYAWITEHVLKLPEPIPCKGALGLWTLPDEIGALVRAQLANLAEVSA